MTTASSRRPAGAGARAGYHGRQAGGNSSTSRPAISTQSAAVAAARAPSAVLSTTQSTPAPVVPATTAPAVTMFYAVEADGTTFRVSPRSARERHCAQPLRANERRMEYLHRGHSCRQQPLLRACAEWRPALVPARWRGDGANAWRGPVQVGNGWQSFAKIFRRRRWRHLRHRARWHAHVVSPCGVRNRRRTRVAGPGRSALAGSRSNKCSQPGRALSTPSRRTASSCSIVISIR